MNLLVSANLTIEGVIEKYNNSDTFLSTYATRKEKIFKNFIW